MYWFGLPLAFLLFGPLFLDGDWRTRLATTGYTAEQSGSFTTQEGGTGIPPTKSEGGTGIPPTRP